MYEAVSFLSVRKDTDASNQQLCLVLHRQRKYNRLVGFCESKYRGFLMTDYENLPGFKENSEYLKSTVASIQDYPKPGILFRDVTTLCEDKKAFSLCFDMLAEIFKDSRIDKIVSAEARGFVFGAPLADRLKAGLVLVRKPGKLPRATLSEDYVLEYGTNTLQIHEDSIKPGERILIMDDLLATGGTVDAMIRLIKRCGGEIVSAAFILELFDLGGARLIREKFGIDTVSLVKLPGH